MVGVVTKTLSLQSNLEARSIGNFYGSLRLYVCEGLPCVKRLQHLSRQLQPCNTVISWLDHLVILYYILNQDSLSRDLSRTEVLSSSLYGGVKRGIIATERLKVCQNKALRQGLWRVKRGIIATERLKNFKTW